MTRPTGALWMDHVTLLYIDALEAEDDHALATLWRAACDDAALAALLLELDEALLDEDQAPTTATVVNHLGPVSLDDQQASTALLSLCAPLPEDLSQRSFDLWVSALPVKASRGYWRAFRKVAVLLALGRAGQGIALAAARSADPGNGKGGKR